MILGLKLKNCPPRSGSYANTASRISEMFPISRRSPRRKPKVVNRRLSTQASPFFGPRAKRVISGTCNSGRKPNVPRNGYSGVTPFTEASSVWPSTNRTVGNVAVRAVANPSDLALASNGSAISSRAVSLMSDAMTSPAPRSRPLSTRSAKLPTALTAATAVRSAPPRANISPERQSRQNWRLPWRKENLTGLLRSRDPSRGEGSCRSAMPMSCRGSPAPVRPVVGHTAKTKVRQPAQTPHHQDYR